MWGGQRVYQMKESVPTAVSDPMLSVSPNVEAAWLERVAKGALVGLVVGLAGLCHSLLINLRVELVCSLADFLLPAFGAFWAVSIWLMTSPEHRNPYWLLYLRWASRAGALIALASGVIPLVARGALRLSVGTVEDFAVAYQISSLTASAGMIAVPWYVSRLSGWLGDRVLQISFSVIKWVSAAVYILIAITEITQWDKTTERSVRVIESGHDWGPSASAPWSLVLCWIIFCMGIGLWFAWLQWRFWRRLKVAANRIRQKDMTATVND